MADVVIRPATAHDLDALVAFGEAVVPAHYTPIIGETAAQAQLDLWWRRERFEAALSHGLLLVAADGRVLVGVCEVGEWEGEPVVWKLYVRPENRGRGVGEALLEAAVAEAPRSASRILLEHLAGNERAAAFYERRGFRHVRTDPAQSGDPAAAIVWRALDLASR